MNKYLRTRLGVIHSIVRNILKFGDETDIARTDKVLADYHRGLLTTNDLMASLCDIVEDREFGLYQSSSLGHSPDSQNGLDQQIRQLVKPDQGLYKILKSRGNLTWQSLSSPSIYLIASSEQIP